MFERALKREPEAAHIHYGLAATRARLGSIDLALESLQKALDLQPNLRVRAQHDHDLNPLRNDPDFVRLIFSSPSHDNSPCPFHYQTQIAANIGNRQSATS